MQKEVGGEFSPHLYLSNQIDPELRESRDRALSALAGRSVINRLFSFVHVTPSLSTQSPAYLPARLPRERRACVSAHIPRPQWSTTGDSRGGLMQRDIVATSLMVVKMTFSSELWVSHGHCEALRQTGDFVFTSWISSFCSHTHWCCFDVFLTE